MADGRWCGVATPSEAVCICRWRLVKASEPVAGASSRHGCGASRVSHPPSIPSGAAVRPRAGMRLGVGCSLRPNMRPDHQL